MLNIETDLDRARAQGVRVVTVETVVPVVEETLTVVRPATATREARTTDCGKSPEEWTWEDLRSYVVRQIEIFSGPFPVDPVRQKAIFSSFCTRHGKMAGPIAVAAFTVFQGRWKGAPISVNRFCKNSDEFFADLIKARLTSL